MKERYRAELRCRRRRLGESIRELAQDIRGLMLLAYPGQGDSVLGQHIARDAFLTALDDPELQIDVRKSDPRTFEETVRLASRYEITKAAVEASTSTGHRRVSRRIEEIPEEMPPVEARAVTQQHRDPGDSSRTSPVRDERSQREPLRQDRRSPRKRERRNRAIDRGVVSSSQPGVPSSPVETSQVNEIMKKLQDMESAGRQREAEFAAKLDSTTKEMERYKCLEQARSKSAARPVPVQKPVQQPPSQQSVPVGQGESSRPTYTCWNC